MKRSTGQLLHTLKDGLRTVRYTIRAEADAPGATLPKAVGAIDLAPFIAVGSTVGKPALRALDGLLTQVETIAGGVIRHDGASAAYPADIATFFDGRVAFSDIFYDVYKRLLLARGAKNILLSEHAFDDAQARFRARHGDVRRSAAASSAQASAGLACALAEARPIRKLDLRDGAAAGPQLMLAPNIVCAAFVGLTVALVTRDPSLKSDLEGLEESVGSVVDARFDRFKRAMSGKSPITELAAQFETVLPFMP